MNINKLTPIEQWEADFEDGSIKGILQMTHHGNVNTVAQTGEYFNHTDFELIVLARKAFEVSIRRGWWYIPREYDGDKVTGWGVDGKGIHYMLPNHILMKSWLNPFIALVRTDEWYKENIEKHMSETI